MAELTSDDTRINGANGCTVCGLHPVVLQLLYCNARPPTPPKELVSKTKTLLLVLFSGGNSCAGSRIIYFTSLLRFHEIGGGRRSGASATLRR